jgi:four helix bundle protein
MANGEQPIANSRDMRDFRKLDVWEKAHVLTSAVYAATRSFPRDEGFGLTSQVRRSAASIPANIAEGCGRSGDREFVRFLDIAMGSASELAYQLLLARDLGYFSSETYTSLEADMTRVMKMLSSLIRTIRPSLRSPAS